MSLQFFSVAKLNRPPHTYRRKQKMLLFTPLSSHKPLSSVFPKLLLLPSPRADIAPSCNNHRFNSGLQQFGAQDTWGGISRESDLNFPGPVSGSRSFQLAPIPNSLSFPADLKGLCLQESLVRSTCFRFGNLLAATWLLTAAQPGFCPQSAHSWLFRAPSPPPPRRTPGLAPLPFLRAITAVLQPLPVPDH